MVDLYSIANHMQENSQNNQEFVKYALISEIVSNDDWIFKVKAEEAIQILGDLQVESPHNAYVELIVNGLNRGNNE